MSESEYKKLVIADYDRQVEAHLLPSELLVPKPANIKAEVVKICEQGFELSAGDEKILRSFVGIKENVAAYRNAFWITKADLFRPLVNLLADRSIKTNIRNIDLLALLIGFPSRPYHPNLKFIANPEIGVMPNPPVEEDPKPTQLRAESDVQQKKRKNYQLLWIFAPIMVVGMGWYLISKKIVKHYTGREDCMIWNDDHYEPIECDDLSTATTHYPIQRKLVDNFKRITHPDTLTYRSIRKVWYSNYKGRMEFYTYSGPNPLDTTLRVLPMTTHILEKYVLHITN